MKKRPIQLLLLEDNPGDARLLREYLRSDEPMQLEVSQVSTLASGLDSLAEKTPEVILTDLGLPDSQGLNTFTQLHAAAPQVPIVVLTGLGDTQLAAQAVKAGAQDYLNKDEITSSFLRRSVSYAIERKQAIETLQQNEERFRLMFENVPMGYQSLDAKGCFLDVNTSFLDMLGYSRQEVIGHSFAEFLHPDHVALFKKQFPILTQSHEVLRDIEFTLRRRDGSFMETSFTTRLVRDDADRFIRTHSAFQDISVRKQGERAILLMAETQRQIAAQTSVTDILTLVGTRTLELIENGYIIISQLDESINAMRIIEVYGLGDLYDKYSKELNFNPKNITFPLANLPPDDPRIVKDGKLKIFKDGLYSLALKKIPRKICTLLEKELSLKETYTMAFTMDDIFYGGLTILAKNNLEQYRELIEATANQATLAIQRIQSQEALQASEEQYRLLAENIQDVIWVMDIRSNRFVYVSPSVTRMRGFSPEEVLAQPVSESLTPHSAQEVAAWLGQFFQPDYDPNPLRTFLVEQPCKDGSNIWTEVSINLIRDEKGEPYQILGVSRDISERRKSDQQIRLQAAALESAANAMVITDRNGSIQWINPAYENLTGYSLSEVIGQNPRILKSGVQTPEFYKNLWDIILSGRVWQSELVNKRKDGSLYVEEETITPLLDESGGITHFIGIKQDISERKQAEIERQRVEDDLRKSEERFRNILETIEDGYYEVDLKGSLTFFNPALAKIYRYEPDELKGMNYTQYMDTGNAELVFLTFNQIFRTGVPAHDIAWVVTCKDGEKLSIEASASLFKDLDGNNTGFRGIVRDVTQRKKIEADLHQSESELRALFAALPDVVLMFDRDGRYFKVADSNQDLLYKPMDELVGKTLHDVFPISEANLFNGYIQKVLDTSKKVHFEYSLQIADQLTWFAATITPMTEKSVIWVARDITENKKAELELQKSEARLRESQKVSRIGSYDLDMKKNIWTSSTVLDELFGIDPGFVKTLESWVGLVHPDEQQEMLAYFNKVVVENRKPFNKEYRVVRPADGVMRWMWGLGSLIFDEDGLPNRLVGTIQDITPRKLAEIARQESHSLLQTTLESTADGILVVDLQGRITMTNQNFANMWGVSRDQLEGFDISEVRNRILPELRDPQTFIDKTMEIYADPSEESFDLIELKDGHIYERVTRPQYQEKTIVGRVSSFRDITDRKLSENLVRESETKYRSLFDNVPDGVYRTTPDGRILAANKALVNMLGYENTEEFIKESAYHVYEDKSGRDGFLEEINKHGVVKNMEVLMRTAQGKTVVGLENTRAFRDENGEVLFYEGTLTDITERKQVETERQTLLEIMQGLTSTDDLREYLQVVHHAIGKVIRANNFFVTLKNKETGMFEEPYFVDEFDQSGSSYDLGKSLTAYVFRSGKPFLNKDGIFEELVSKGEVELVGTNSLSWLGVPLIVSRETIGVMVIQDYEKEDLYSERDVEFLTSISGQVAQAISSKENELRLARQQNEISRLYRASESLLVGSRRDLNSLAQSIVTAVLEEFSQTNCSLFLVQEDIGILERVAAAGPYASNVRDKHIRLDETGLVPEVVRVRKTINVSDVTIMDGYMQYWSEARSEMSVPLLEGERILGVLDIQSADVGAFSADDERMVGIFAGRAALTLAQSLQYNAEQRHSQRLADLQILSAELNSLHTERDLLDMLVLKAALLSSSPVCTVMLLDDKTDDIILASHYGLPGNPPTGLRIPVAQLPGAAQTFKNGQNILIPNVDRDMPAMRKVLIHPDVQAFFAFPLVIDGVVAGAITLSSLKPRQLSEAEIGTYQLLARLASAALDNVRLFEGVNRSLQRMSSLRRVDMAISASFDLVLTLNILLEQVTANLGVDAADILVYDTTDSNLKYACGRGFRSQALRYTNLRIGEGFAGQAAMERSTIHISNLQDEMNYLDKSMSLPSEGFISYWGVPLVAKGNIQGVLEVFSRQPVQVDQDWTNYMETLAGQAAIAVDNVLLFNHLERSNADLSLAYDSTLTGWATALELRDNETEGHTRRVAATTTQLAIKMGVQDKDIMYMRWGSLLHDIGKMGIPDSILLKPGPLSDEEWVIMRTHPVLAYEMLSPIDYLANALDIPYNHHEKWDGSGYPRGLKGEQIPLSARIFAIVDVWDALTSDRPYRAAWSHEKTMDYIREQVGTHFDPRVATAFLEMIGMEGKLPGK